MRIADTNLKLEVMMKDKFHIEAIVPEPLNVTIYFLGAVSRFETQAVEGLTLFLDFGTREFDSHDTLGYCGTRSAEEAAKGNPPFVSFTGTLGEVVCTVVRTCYGLGRDTPSVIVCVKTATAIDDMEGKLLRLTLSHLCYGLTPRQP